MKPTHIHLQFHPWNYGEFEKCQPRQRWHYRQWNILLQRQLGVVLAEALLPPQKMRRIPNTWGIHFSPEINSPICQWQSVSLDSVMSRLCLTQNTWHQLWGSAFIIHQRPVYSVMSVCNVGQCWGYIQGLYAGAMQVKRNTRADLRHLIASHKTCDQPKCICSTAETTLGQQEAHCSVDILYPAGFLRHSFAS